MDCQKRDCSKHWCIGYQHTLANRLSPLPPVKKSCNLFMNLEGKYNKECTFLYVSSFLACLKTSLPSFSGSMALLSREVKWFSGSLKGEPKHDSDMTLGKHL